MTDANKAKNDQLISTFKSAILQKLETSLRNNNERIKTANSVTHAPIIGSPRHNNDYADSRLNGINDLGRNSAEQFFKLKSHGEERPAGKATSMDRLQALARQRPPNHNA